MTIREAPTRESGSTFRSSQKPGAVIATTAAARKRGESIIRTNVDAAADGLNAV